MSWLLEAKDISLTIKKRQILQSVSLTVAPGEIVGLLGPNGAGKTSCFYTICGLVRPDQGQITFNGKAVEHLPMYRRARLGMGYLPQERSVFHGLNTYENIAAILELRGFSHQEVQDRANQLLEQFDLLHVRQLAAISLSGGETRRLELARALASDVKLLLLDEPFAGVDPVSLEEFQSLVKKLRELGLSILITDHNVRDTFKLVDRAYVIYEGKVLISGKPSEVMKDSQVRKVYLGESFSH